MMITPNKPDYGKKYTCFKCGCKFYDLNKKEAICPKCKSDQKNAPLEPIRQTKTIHHPHPKTPKGAVAGKAHAKEPSKDIEGEEPEEVKDAESDDDSIPILDTLLDGDEEEEGEF